MPAAAHDASCPSRRQIREGHGENVVTWLSGLRTPPSHTKRAAGEQPDVTAALDARFFRHARTHYRPDLWDAGVREGAGLGFEGAINRALNDAAYWPASV